MTRLKGKWRARMFEALIERDGAFCGECGEPHRTIWRAMGCWSGDPWGVDAWERYRYTKVIPTSILEVEHRIPLSQGGTNDIDNLWLCCVDCHKRKTSTERSTRLKQLFAEARA